ncbi:MAG: ATP synthase F0 subunit C [Holophagales bacterium]|nr:ATP synthase F0 subunit C [Holophagales bacterium]MYG30520.1 ATP synthase F0 subunit C [Holophagales bacterium]MYI81566.1 ATP synthase F0 subunit C [Holophagales bacterium]
MKKSKLVLLVALLLTLFAAPALAQDGAESDGGGANLGLLGAAVGIGIAAAGGAIGQGRATGEACAGLARNPGAGGRIQIMLLIGLAFMESVVIYALVIALRGAGFV